MTRLLLALCLACSLSACTYLKYASVQAEYARIQNAEPGLLNVKHMLDRDNYFVNGLCVDAGSRFDGLPKAIAAFSSRHRTNERVDTMHFQVSGSHYGLNLPAGRFALLVFADINEDGTFAASEVVGSRMIELNETTAPERVLGQIDLELTEPVTVAQDIRFAVPDLGDRSDSLFYPSGTIRSLDDPIFDGSFATLGMYDPASFLEQAPTMFYALEEDLGYKIPVVFVHGIGGSARNFATFAERLDRLRYKPWFFHYPSGGDLDQLAELFYQIYLSGKMYRSEDMPVIVVAHSMGGLVVREAINRYRGKLTENQVHLLITMATPFGGHAAAAKGEQRGLIVLPSWRDLNPASPFLRNLFREPLPEFMHHELIYAYQNTSTIKLGENSDGVVTLASQLMPQAQSQADGQFGFDNSHTDILDSDEVTAHITSLMDQVKNPFPAAQLEYLHQGGYNVPLSAEYSAMTKYVIRHYGKYLMALSDDRLEAFHPNEERFIDVIKGKKRPRDDAERSWLKFLEEYPELRSPISAQ